MKENDDLLIAPLMELKLPNRKDRCLYRFLLIAPLMELKLKRQTKDAVNNKPFNRTAYGIETCMCFLLHCRILCF